MRLARGAVWLKIPASSAGNAEGGIDAGIDTAGRVVADAELCAGRETGTGDEETEVDASGIFWLVPDCGVADV